MKTIIRIATLLFLATTVSYTMAQTVKICAGDSTALTAVNSLGLWSPSYSLNPGGITSPNGIFMVTPASTVTYTLYVTGIGTNTNAAVITTSNLVTVQVTASVQVISAVTPVNQVIGCAAGAIATATGIAISPTTNVTHLWYSPANPTNPTRSSGQTSVFAPTLFGSIGINTFVLVDNASGCSTSKTIEVTTTGGSFPFFSLNSSQNFSIGCATTSLTNVQVLFALAGSGGIVSYTMLPPGYAGGTTYTTSTSINTFTMNTPGNYTVIVKDNSSFCETRIPVSITQDTMAPIITGLSVSQSTLTCANSTVAIQAAPMAVPFPTVNYNWLPFAVPGNSLVLSTNPAMLTQSLLTTVTLVATSVNNACESSTVIPIYQNIRPPFASIGTSMPGVCQNTLILTNTSLTGILPNTFTSFLPVVASWEGPSPQAAASNTNTYLAQASGVYTMTAVDMNNGCTQSATLNVTLGPTAAFTQTVTGGLAAFTDVSTGTNGSSTYFWNFGDGNGSSVENPTHTYLNGGAQLVTFKVTNLTNSCSDSVTQSVNVSGVPCSANSNFSMIPTATAQVWNAIPAYPWNVTAASWNWGDGSNSNALYTSHQYASAGLYNICLSVTVSCVDSSTTCTSYNVYRTSQQAMVIKVNVLAPGIISGLAPMSANEQLSWDILPNPNPGEFNLSLNTALNVPVRVAIYDLTGRRMQDQVMEPGIISVSVHSGQLPAGMYLVTLESSGLKTTKRMVINR